MGRKLPGSDWVLIPFIAFVTMLAVPVVAGLLSGIFLDAGDQSSHSCLILDDPSTGVRAVPNSVCREKIAESGWIEYRFNACGHRSDAGCGPKTKGTYRIVMIGSSYAEGYSVERNQSFAFLLPRLLSRETGRRIELYNEGMQWGTPHAFDLRFADVLAASPDLILWPVSSWDVYNADLTLPFPVGANAVQKPGKLSVRRLFLSYCRKGIFLFRHLVFKSEKPYLEYYLRRGNAEYLDALKVNASPDWQHRLNQFQQYAEHMATRAKMARIPFVVTALPGHAQADLIAVGSWSADVNPYRFGQQLKTVVDRAGGTYLEILPCFQSVGNIHEDFYPMDQHLNSSGHRLLAEILAKQLAGSAVLQKQ